MSTAFYNLLIDELPTTVKFGGVEHPIRTDFRTALIFETLVEDESIGNEDKLIKALILFYPELPQTEDEILEAVEQLVWFYSCGKEPNEYQKMKNDKRNEASGNRSSLIYNVNYDDDYIFAAFMQQYGINLNKADLHWWEFKALFKGLTDDTEIMKIMGYRAMEIKPNMAKEQKAHYKKLKMIYALPKAKEESERERLITEALMNGGDVSKVLKELDG